MVNALSITGKKNIKTKEFNFSVGKSQKWEIDTLLINDDALSEADLVALVVEPRYPGTIERQLINQLKHLEAPAIVVINKVDSVQKSALLPVLEAHQVVHVRKLRI